MTYQFLKRKLREYADIKSQIQSLSRDLERENPDMLSDPSLMQALKNLT